MRRTPALIVGGGPAGATLALALARRDLPHLLLERHHAPPDSLCGGFLSWRTLALLESVGMSPATLNPEPVTRLRILAGTRAVEAALPRPARAVSRRRLDAMMLAAAERAGARIERGVHVKAVDDRTVRLDDATTLAADALFLASGKHDVRGVARPAAARGDDPALGLRIRLEPHPTLDRLVGDAIELHLFDGGYAGLVRQEDGSANLCMAVRRSRLDSAGDPQRLLAALGNERPALGERLAYRGAGSVDAVANVPYGWRALEGRHGLFRLGDQAGVIPSLAGEGMAIAIASGLSAADAYARGGAAAALAFQPMFAKRLRRPIGVAAFARDWAERPAMASRALRLGGVAPHLLSLVARLTRI